MMRWLSPVCILCFVGCNFSFTGEIKAFVCGDGLVETELGETCDPPESCPPTCDDGNPCTDDSFDGSATGCDLRCTHIPFTPCCGDGIVDQGAGETCDPPSSCPTSCQAGQACTAGVMQGSPDTCSAACITAPITTCADGDGCCLASCDVTTDTDCFDPNAPSLGQGVEIQNILAKLCLEEKYGEESS